MKDNVKLTGIVLELAQEMARGSETLKALAEALETAEGHQDTGEKAPVDAPRKAGTKKPEKDEPVKADEPVTKDAIHDLMVRLTLAKKTEQVKAILSDYAPRLSKVKEADYPELYKRLKELEVK